MVERWTGVSLPLSAAANVEAFVGRRARTHGLSPDEYLDRLARGLLPEERGALADGLLNHTSWFLREPEGLSHLLDALEACVSAGPRRVWCAGCAEGHEPYSIAMLAADRGLPVTIYATDLGPSTLARARAGRFPVSHLRHVPAPMQDRYFEFHGAGAEVRPAIRELVHFAEHNLVAAPHRPTGEAPFDAVVCRNVLIYFHQETSLAVLRAFAAAAPRGVVLLGAAEQPLVWLTDALEPDGRAGAQLLVARRDGVRPRRGRAPGARGGSARRVGGPPRITAGAERRPLTGRAPARDLRERARRAARPHGSGPRPSRPRLVAAPKLPARAPSSQAGAQAEGGAGASQAPAPRRVRRQLKAEGRVREASLMLGRGEDEAALAVLDEVLASEPMLAVAHVARGLVLKRRGALREAVAAFRNARFLTQDGAWMAPYQLGLCLEQLGDLPGAREAYRHALEVLEGGGVSGTKGFGGTDLDDGMATTIAASCRARLASL